MHYGFKLKKADAPTKLVAFDEQPSWKDLTSKIAHLFHISSDNVGVVFIDEGREIITVDNEEELQSFNTLHPSEVTKFVVQDLKAPDSECAFRALLIVVQLIPLISHLLFSYMSYCNLLTSHIMHSSAFALLIILITFAVHPLFQLQLGQ